MFTLNPESEELRIKLQRVKITRDLIQELHDMPDIPAPTKSTFAEWLANFEIDMRKLLTRIVQIDLVTLTSQPLIIHETPTHEDQT